MLNKLVALVLLAVSVSAFESPCDPVNGCIVGLESDVDGHFGKGNYKVLDTNIWIRCQEMTAAFCQKSSDGLNFVVISGSEPQVQLRSGGAYKGALVSCVPVGEQNCDG
ncbi:uncharacterized protein L969DRAFT_96919 [Mixia osmundae IAM 14324]|uniref:Uncharacterized protein n=1 Tax=Mixia osmundae (strain CBS 9802 / IAM 14324 / JCM 22182 / KY 12970) TaxID=764103 RepID=G7E2H2_MIXOS|nr:uncharacterized protein L969DRAFT_96919 [Mixia osmundae IAM 14324]KEI36903.1 hypothetical protein L969DRAFT_96919 [Mixia osmundae IAM 14324]GAA97032.1 hypothetical protein E5Q_03707 [Mixia osmundae IAM 14324]